MMFLLGFVAVLCSGAAIFFANRAVDKKSETYIYNVNTLPTCHAALLLGTSKYVRSGHINHYYAYRIDAAVALFKSGKVSHIVISGDNSRSDYNEPQEMKDDLMARGVPAEKITLDYAGFNTYDSVLRMEKIFEQQQFIVVSQRFHCERAIYIAHWVGLEAYGFPAQDVTHYYGFKTMLREKLARVKMFLDLLSGRDPHFLGETIELK